MNKYIVERWDNWNYPSHWGYDNDFFTEEDAVEYCTNQKKPSDFRVITVVWETE